MATGGDVLKMLCAGKEYTVYGDDYESINWYGQKPAITKTKFEAGFAEFDAWKAQQDATQAATKSALLARLGITEDEAKLLLS
jgi:hypothetical protein